MSANVNYQYKTPTLDSRKIIGTFKGSPLEIRDYIFKLGFPHLLKNKIYIIFTPAEVKVKNRASLKTDRLLNVRPSNHVSRLGPQKTNLYTRDNPSGTGPADFQSVYLPP